MAGCKTVTLDCGIPRPSPGAVGEMIKEAERGIAGEPLLMPYTHVWHKEIIRACK